MAAIRESVEIARRPEDVFAYLDDYPRHTEWQTNLVSARVDGEGPIGVGSKITEVRRMGKREQPVVLRRPGGQHHADGETGGVPVQRQGHRGHAGDVPGCGVRREALLVPVAIVCLHVGYGAGLLAGAARHAREPVRPRRVPAPLLPLWSDDARSHDPR